MHGSLRSKETSKDTINIPLAITEIDLDNYTSLLLAAKDTIKPDKIAVIFASEDSIKDIRVTIQNPYGQNIFLENDKKSPFFGISKNHKIVGLAELAWNRFEQLCRIKRLIISTNRRQIELNNMEKYQFISFHDYLIDQQDPEPSEQINSNGQPINSNFVTPPEILRKVDPHYPEIAIRSGLEGSVVVKVWVDRKGKVKKAVIVSSSSSTFEGPAIEAAMQYLFSPARSKDGYPISVWVMIPYRFRLSGIK